jgi:hypothetical protein
MTPGTKCTYFKGKDPVANVEDGSSIMSAYVNNEVSKGIIKSEYLHFYNDPSLPAQVHVFDALPELTSSDQSLIALRKEMENKRN